MRIRHGGTSALPILKTCVEQNLGLGFKIGQLKIETEGLTVAAQDQGVKTSKKNFSKKYIWRKCVRKS